jgi:hypothetical protein
VLPLVEVPQAAKKIPSETRALNKGRDTGTFIELASVESLDLPSRRKLQRSPCVP